MGDFLKLGKAWVIAAIVCKVAFVAVLLVSAVAFVFGDGGTFTVSWVPGGAM